MDVKRLTPILNVSNIVESFAWFEKLGWQKGWEWGDPPSFGGVYAVETSRYSFVRTARDRAAVPCPDTWETMTPAASG